MSALAIFLQNEFENDTFKSTTTSPRGQLVNSQWPSDAIWVNIASGKGLLLDST